MQRMLQIKGYAASGLNELVVDSGAPKGSIYHHFPGGKEEIARLQHSRELLAAALLCRFDHPLDECRVMNDEIDRRLTGPVGSTT